MKKFTSVVQQSKWTTKDILEQSLFESKKITSEADFKAWAKTVLQKAFGSDFDEEKYNDVVNGLLDKYGDNYGAMVGALSYGLSEGKDDKMARYDRFFQMAEKVYDEVPYDKLTNRKLIQSALKKHGYPTDPLTVGEVLRLIQREIINDSKAPFSPAMIDDIDDLETLIQMADDLGIKNVQNLPREKLKKLIRDAYNKNFVNEAKIESDADFKEYAENVLKKAFGEDYDDDTAQKMITDLIDKYDGDYGAMLGALTSGLEESLNEAARVGKSDWSAVLKDLKREGWDINNDIASMFYANDDEEERKINLSNYNDDVMWTIYDGKGKELNSGSFDAEGLSAGELNMEVWGYVDESLNEALQDDWSIGHEYGVFRTGGSIGEKTGVVANLGGEVGILVSTFNDEKDAKEYAKRMRVYLSPGERKYYGMSYKVKKLDSKIKDQMSKLMA